MVFIRPLVQSEGRHVDCDVLGFGTGAICQIGGCLSQNKESLIAWRRVEN